MGPTTNFETLILKFHELLNDLIVSDASDREKQYQVNELQNLLYSIGQNKY